MKSYVTIERTQTTTIEVDIPDGQEPYEYASARIPELPLDDNQTEWATADDSYEVVTVERAGISFP